MNVAEPLPEVSIVIPVFNEEENVADLVAQVEGVMIESGRSYELIIVDDGSLDATRLRLAEVARSRPALRPIFLTRNYGQSTALQAGFDHARGHYLVTLDGDLQNDPADIPMMLELLDTRPDVDCISGWRKDRQDAQLSRKIPSRLANWLISRVTRVPLHDYGCALKAYRRTIIDDLHLYGELHRFIPALAVEVGARLIEVPVRHHARTRGSSKYGIDRTIRVLLDLIWIRFMMRFMTRPIHAIGGAGVMFGALGGLILSWLAIEKLAFGAAIGGRPLLLLGALLLLLGANLLATGLLGEFLTRIYHEPKGRRQYVLRTPPEAPRR
jgi:glycosyltransferase involved in cell wall biosynthesis